MDRTKPHVEGGLRLMYLWYNIFANSPVVKTLATTNVETGLKFKNIEMGRHFMKMSVKWEVISTCRTRTSPMATHSRTKVEVDLDMLCALVMNEIGGEADGADVVTVDEIVFWQWSMELLEELLELTSFSHAVGHGAILRLDTRLGDDILALGGLGDEVATEEHSVAWGGSACIRTTRSVRICVDCQLEGESGASQVEAKVQWASQIPQNTLHRGEVRLLGIMHMEADLMDGVGDVGAGERQVLEGPGRAPKLSRISNRRHGSGGDLGLRVHGRRDRFTVHHTSTLKDIDSELVLSEEEFICLMLYGDSQKMVERSFMVNSRLSANMVCCRSVVVDVVSTMSST
jgi:hypothetical protein